MRRPRTLTPERARSVIPSWMLGNDWPDKRLMKKEARYVLWLYERHTMRSVAAEIFGDSVQWLGDQIIEAARRALEPKETKGA
jgi:hypothetical protein